MKAGEPVWISEGNGWRREGTFIKVVEAVTFRRVTLSQLMRKDFDLGRGRKERLAYVEYINDNGKKVKANFNPRRISARRNGQ